MLFTWQCLIQRTVLSELISKYWCPCKWVTAACLCLVQKRWPLGQFWFIPSSVCDEEKAAMVGGLCSSQFPPLCSTAAETKLHFFLGRPIGLMLSHFHSGTEALLLSQYREINNTSLLLLLYCFSVQIRQHVWMTLSDAAHVKDVSWLA